MVSVQLLFSWNKRWWNFKADTFKYFILAYKIQIYIWQFYEDWIAFYWWKLTSFFHNPNVVDALPDYKIFKAEQVSKDTC